MRSGSIQAGALLALLSCAVLSAGCSKDGASELFPRPVISSLSEAGFEVSGLEKAAANPYHASECVRGEVSKLDLLICRFESEKTARASEGQFDKFLSGAVSGVARRSGSLVLAIADRDRVDLQGVKINKLLEAFSGTKKSDPQS
jgi:hypothetical protein